MHNIYLRANLRQGSGRAEDRSAPAHVHLHELDL
jgi:hypothetical protein